MMKPELVFIASPADATVAGADVGARQTTFEEYRIHAGINASALKAGRVSMRHMRYVMTGGQRAATPSMRLGTLIHAAVLEPLLLMRLCRVWDGPKRGKDWTDFKSEAAGMYIVTPGELDGLQSAVNAANNNEVARKLLSQTRHEVSCYWRDEDMGPCKARCDGVSEALGVLEVKSAANLDLRALGNQFVSMGYDIQCGWYREAALRSGASNSKQVHILYIESVPPFDCACWPVPERALTKGLELAREIALEYRAAERDGAFAGVQTDGDFPLPDWYEGDVDLDNIMPMSEDGEESDF